MHVKQQRRRNTQNRMDRHISRAGQAIKIAKSGSGIKIDIALVGLRITIRNVHRNGTVDETQIKRINHISSGAAKAQKCSGLFGKFNNIFK